MGGERWAWGRVIDGECSILCGWNDGRMAGI